MIKLTLIFILMMMSFTLHSKDYYLFSIEPKSKVEILNVDGKNVSATCKHLQCLAFKAKKRTAVKVPNKLRGNPNSEKCQQAGGAPLVLLDFRRNEYDFCRFSDSSLIKSGDI